MEPTSPDVNMASQYALRVALQTLKERCISLQRRMVAVEEDNQQLRERLDDADNPVAQMHTNKSGGAAENFQLRLQVAELQRQKTQLNEHINMVSIENRKLWSRLSQMAKDQDKTIVIGKDNDILLTNEVDSPRSSGSGGGANQNLIRSKTFTQHSPNPNLRHKLISNETPAAAGDISLEEVALEAYDEKNIDIGVDGAGEDYADTAEPELGFAYLNVNETDASTTNDNEADFNFEAKKCVDGLHELRREAVKQQQELNSALTMLESRIVLQPCPDCAQKSLKPEMADKSLETDDSLSEIRNYAPLHNGHGMQKSTDSATIATNATQHINIIQEKLQADAMDRTCPMCGKIYSSLLSFDMFKEHVEMHFIDDASDVDISMERNFEFVSHTVGDF